MADETHDDPKAVEQAQFFMDLIKSGEAWPEDEWDRARVAYEGDTKEEKAQRVNLWRSTIDTSLAFQLQIGPTIRISPAGGFEDDERAVGRAACDQALVRYLWREMGFMENRLRVIKGARIIGLGFGRTCMDMRRMLPTVKHLDPEQVRVDPTCKGKMADASWVAFYEYVSPDMLAKDHPALDATRLSKASSPAAGILGDPDAKAEQAEELTRSRTAVGKHLRRVRLWRLFLRNAAALYDKEPADEEDKEAGPHLDRFRDKEGMTEPRRYVELVEGYDGALVVDEIGWPEALALDFDAWPIKRLAFNEAHDRVSGFTDRRHLQRIEGYLERALGNANRAMSLKHSGALGKGAGNTMSESQIKAMLETEGVKVIPDAIGPDGKPVLVALFQDAGLVQEDVSWMELLLTQHDFLSGVPKVKQGAEPDYDTATEATIASEAGSARSEDQLRLIEDWDAEIVAQIQAMAHVTLRQLSSVEVVVPEEYVFGEEQDAPELVPAHPEVMDGLQWVQVQQILTEQPDAQLVSLGVEAMVGPELAQWWVDGEPLEVVRCSTTVTVERGSTQRRTRERKVMLALQMYEKVLAPIYQQTGRTDLLVKFATLLFELQDLGTDFGSALPKPEEVLAQLQQAQEQQAQAAEQEGMRADEQAAGDEQDRGFQQQLEVEKLQVQAQGKGGG